jgi:23S rRNA (uridine2552-2'-O)-methyltransferase
VRPSGERGGKKGFVAKGNARYDRHDPYYRQAKKEGFVARSIYKLEEIDEQFGLITPSSVVLDLGCAPGSWMQYVARKVMPQKGGRAVGIDLLPVHTSFPSWVKILVGDIYAVSDDELLPEGVPVDDKSRPFDVVLSDMAPNTTGVRSVDQARSLSLAEAALAIAERRLKPGGVFCVKILEGGEMKSFIEACQRAFTTVKIRRPKGTREGSKETYVVGLERRNSSEAEIT